MTPDRKNAPAILDAANFSLSLKPYRHFRLDNGVDVYAVDAGEQDVMLAEWVFQAGNWQEDQNILAATANFMLKSGTAAHSALQINEHAEFYGAYLNRHCYNETATLSLHCLSRHFEDLAPLIADILSDSVFPQDELDIYRQNQQQRLAVNLKKCDFVAHRLIDAALYGEEHPYGRYTSAAAFDAIGRDRVAAFYDEHYRRGYCRLFLAGKLPAGIEGILNRHFGSLPFTTQARTEQEFKPVCAAEKKQRIAHDPEGVQGAVRMARPFPNRHHPDYPGMQVLNSIFGGFFGSRLMSNIREDKGYTYGIHSYIQNHLRSGALMISTEAGKDVCEATVSEVYKEMERLRNEPVGEEELRLVKNYMIGSLLGDLDGPFQIIARWKNYILNGLDESYFTHSLETIRGIRPEELQALAEKYLDPGSFYELIVA